MNKRIWLSVVVGVLLLGAGGGLILWRPLARRLIGRDYERGRILMRLERYDEAIKQFERILAREATHWAARFQLGVAYHRKKDYEKAIVALGEAKAAKPSYLPTLLELADVHLDYSSYLRTLPGSANAATGQVEAAEVVIGEILSRAPGEPRAHEMSARLNQMKGQSGQALLALERALELDPGLKSARMSMARMLIDRNQYDQAAAQYATVLAQDPAEADARLWLARIHRKQGKFSEGIALVREGLARSAKDGSLRLELAELYLAEAERTKAPELYDQSAIEAAAVLESNPRTPRAAYIRGAAHLARGRPEEAIQDLISATAMAPDVRPDAHYLLGAAYAQVGKLQQSITEFKRALALKPDATEVRVVLAQVLLKAGWAEEAARECDRVLRDAPDNAQARRIKAVALATQEKYDDAEVELRKMLAADFDTPVAYGATGEVEPLTGRPSETLEKYREWVRESPGDLVVRNLLGVAYVRANNLGDATREFQEILNRDPAYVPARVNLARVWIARGDNARAIAECEQGLIAAPRSSILYRLLGWLYHREGRLEDASRHFQGALDLDADNAITVMALASVSTEKKEYERAVELCERAIELLPANPVPHALAARAHEARGRIDEAARAYDRALAFEPSFRPAYRGIYLYAIGGNVEAAKEMCLAALRGRPDYPQVLFALASLQQQTGQYADCLPIFQKLAGSYPGEEVYQEALVNVLMGMGNLDQATVELQDIPLLRPGIQKDYVRLMHDAELSPAELSGVAALLNLGTMYFRAGWPTQAASAFSQALEIDQKCLIVRGMLASLHFAQREFEKSRAACEELIGIEPQFSPAYRILGMTYSRLGEPGLAEESYQKAIEVDPDYLAAHIELGSLYATQDALARARKEFEWVIDFAESRQSQNEASLLAEAVRTARLGLASALEADDDIDGAAVQARHLVEANGDDMQARLVLGELELKMAARGMRREASLEDAVRQATMVLAAGPDSARAYYVRGSAYLGQRNLVRAIEDLSEAASRSPGRWSELHFNLGMALERAGRLEEAERSFRNVLEIEPARVEAKLALAGLALKRRQPEEALSICDSVLAADPQNATAKQLRSTALLGAGRYQEALEILKAVRPEEPGFLDALVSQAASQFAVGRMGEVLSMLSAQAAANPNDLSLRHSLALASLVSGRAARAAATLEAMQRDDPGYLAGYELMAYIARASGGTRKAAEWHMKAASVAPSSPAPLVALAILHASEGNWQEVAVAARQALEREPAGVRARLLLAQAYLGLQSYGECAQVASNILRDVPGSASARRLLASALVANGDYEKASEELKAIWEMQATVDSAYDAALGMLAAKRLEEGVQICEVATAVTQPSPKLLFLRAVLAQRQGDYAKAQAKCNQALQAAPGEQRFEAALIHITMGRGAFDEVKSELTRLQNMRPELKRAYLGLVQRLSESAETSPHGVSLALNEALAYDLGGWRLVARAKYEELVSRRPDDLVSASRLAPIYAMLGEPEKALALYEEIVALDPGFAIAHWAKGQLLGRQGQLEKAATSFRLAAESDPSFAPAKVELARLSASRGDIAGGIAALQAALETGPVQAGWYVELASLYEQAGRVEESIKAYEAALDAGEDSARVHNGLAWAMGVLQGRLEDAMPHAIRAVQLAPTDGSVVDTLGWLHFLQGDYAEALEELEGAAYLRPDSPTVRYHLAEAYAKQNNPESAAREARKALELAPDFPESPKAAALLRLLGAEVPARTSSSAS